MAEQTLFGSYNPQLIQQAIEAERERGLLEQAKLTPQQIINLGAARSGQQMGQALGGVVNTLFGLPSVQDPRLQQAQLGQQAYQEALQASDNDASSPEFFKKLSSSAARLGVTTLAQQAAQQAAKLESERMQGFQRQAAGIASLATATREKQAGALDQARNVMFELGVKDPATLTKEEAAKLNVAREVLKLASPGATINVGDKSADVAAGKIVGEAQATIDNKYSAITSLKSARALLDKGIYAGPYAPLAQGAAKYSGGLIGDRKKVINTETFLSEIGNTVIPRLQEFGGNDSVEELKYLRDVQGGRIDLEPETLRNILNAAEKKINEGIERLKLQSQAIERGKPLPLGEVKVPKTPKTTQRTTKSGTTYQIIED
jgi:hypothetical protein